MDAGDREPPTALLQTAETLSRIVLGGVAIGAACGVAAILVARRTSEHLIEAALTTVVAYGSFLLAEYFHVSGVLAAVAAGLVMGNLGVLSEQDGGVFSSKGREFVLGFWEFAAFLANSAIFLLIGTNVAAMPFQSYGVERARGVDRHRARRARPDRLSR